MEFQQDQLDQLTPQARKVFGVIRRHPGERLTYETIVAESGVPRRTATRAVAQIRAHASALGVIPLKFYDDVGRFEGLGWQVYRPAQAMATPDVHAVHPGMATPDEQSDSSDGHPHARARHTLSQESDVRVETLDGTSLHAASEASSAPVLEDGSVQALGPLGPSVHGIPWGGPDALDQVLAGLAEERARAGTPEPKPSSLDRRVPDRVPPAQARPEPPKPDRRIQPFGREWQAIVRRVTGQSVRVHLAAVAPSIVVELPSWAATTTLQESHPRCRLGQRVQARAPESGIAWVAPRARGTKWPTVRPASSLQRRSAGFGRRSR